MSARVAACMCGALEVHCDGEPVRVSMCHCRACQRRTGSVFGVQARYARGSVRAAGPEQTHARVGDAGGKITTHFCPSCGATVYWEMDGLPDFIAVAVGAFADQDYPPPAVSVYEARRHAWTDMPALTLEKWD